MKEFKNKVAAITGSATGIGRAFAEEAAKRGMRLALIDINTEGLEETKAICEKAGAPKVVTIKTDVTKYEEVRFSILRVMQEYGQLDLMFANAGIATAGWVYNHPPQDWAWAMNTNVLGLTYYVHEVLPIFKQQGTPCHFLFTASIAGLITGLRYNTAYLASKHAAVCIAEAVRDLAENDPDYSMMGVSVFCPEYVHTNIHNSEDHRPADYSVPCDPFYATDSYCGLPPPVRQQHHRQGHEPRIRRSVPVRGRRGEPHVQGAAYAHPRADPRTPQTHQVRPRARGEAAREIRPAAEILIRFLSFRSTPKAPPV